MSATPDPVRILVTDDDDDHARLAAEYLRLNGAYCVDTVGCVRELWARLATHEYDVLLLDYNLPDGNGLDALAEIARRGYELPVVMVTGRGDERIATQAIQQGAVDYLVKAGRYLEMLPALVQKALRAHELMQANRRALEQIRYQALLLENVRDAVVVWNVHGQITFWNRTAEELFGWTAETRLGGPVDAHRAAFEPPLRPPVEAASLNVERCYQRPDSDQAVWVSSNVTTLTDAAGQLLGYMDVARDISQRKRLEAQMTQAARLAAIGEVASGVAHQISNPLTAIIAETQLLQKEAGGAAAWEESLRFIEQAGWKAQQAIQRLLDFSRPAAHTLEHLEVNQTIENALGLVGAHIASSGVALSSQLSEGLPPVYGNARQLEDLWVNLLLLARDATAGGAHRVRLQSCPAEAGWVQVDINDDGDVIPAAHLAQAFEPDFVGFAHGRGTGLELSICREIVRQHHGHIGVTSTAEQGTTFSVRLPAEGSNGRS